MSRNIEGGYPGFEEQTVYDIGSSTEVKKELDEQIEKLKSQLIGLQNSPFKEKDIKDRIAFLEEQRSLISLGDQSEEKKDA